MPRNVMVLITVFLASLAGFLSHNSRWKILPLVINIWWSRVEKKLLFIIFALEEICISNKSFINSFSQGSSAGMLKRNYDKFMQILSTKGRKKGWKAQCSRNTNCKFDLFQGDGHLTTWVSEWASIATVPSPFRQ